MRENMVNPFADDFLSSQALDLKKGNDFNPLTPYNYDNRNIPLDPLTCGTTIEVSADDKILSLKSSILSSVLSISFENGVLSVLGVDGVVIDSVNLPLETFLKEAYYDAEAKDLVFVFTTDKGENTIRINVSDLVDVYTAGLGLKVENNEFSIDEEVVATKEDVATLSSEVDGKISEASTSVDEKISALTDEMNSKIEEVKALINTIVGGDIADLIAKVNSLVETVDGEVKPAIQKLNDEKVSYTVFDKGGQNYKTIVLDNHANLLGTSTEGGAYNLAMVSKWDVADFGSAQLPINLNGSKARPTYNDIKEIALLEDIHNVDPSEFATKVALEQVNDRFGDLSGSTVSAAINAVASNLSGEVIERQAADNAIAENLQGVSDRVAALENAGTVEPSEPINISEDLKLTKVDDLHYKLTYKEDNLGEVSIPEDQFLESVAFIPAATAEDKVISDEVVVGDPYIKFVFKVTGDEKVNTYVPVKELVDSYVAGNGLLLVDNKFEIKVKEGEEYLVVDENGISTEGIAKLRTDLDYESSRALGAEANINKELERKVNWDESKSKLVLPVATGAITGTMNAGTPEEPVMGDGAQLVNLSKWNIADFGSSKVHMNLNSSDKVTVNDTEKLVYESDLEVIKSDIATKASAAAIEALQAEVAALRAEIEALKGTASN